jgi:hypothetical protein
VTGKTAFEHLALTPAKLPAVLVLCGLSFISCSESQGSSSPIHPTLVAVTPDDFLGGVACLETPGAMQRYVVTLVDVTSPDAGADAEAIEEFALPSSGPVSCRQRAGSSLVVPGHKYVAEVDGYDRADLVPLAPGSRTMVDAARSFVPPRWSTSCGREPESPVTSVANMTRLVRPCTGLEAAEGERFTGIRVVLDPELVGLECGQSVGQVDHYVVTLADGERSEPASCGAPVDFTGLEPDTGYELDVLAYEQDRESPTWYARCHAFVENGAITPASCDPLAALPPGEVP